jgi:hypothetical protein
LETEARGDEQDQEKRDMTLHPPASVAQAVGIAIAETIRSGSIVQ